MFNTNNALDNILVNGPSCQTNVFAYQVIIQLAFFRKTRGLNTDIEALTTNNKTSCSV